MSSFSVPPNQRSHPRHKTAKDARVIYPDERGLVDVIVRDLSISGACIQLKSSTDLSGKFRLFVPLEKILYTASVRWMKGPVVGLKFMGDPEHVPGCEMTQTAGLGALLRGKSLIWWRHVN